jgi:hypothetical protein
MICFQQWLWFIAMTQSSLPPACFAGMATKTGTIFYNVLTAFANFGVTPSLLQSRTPAINNGHNLR